MRAKGVAGFNPRKYSILLLFLFAFVDVALAANHYVWCGASGSKTGTDFTNAYTDLPASLTRGDTYYVAGSNTCTYGAHTFNDPLSGTSVISILHATASANSGVAGWQSSFGTTPAKWPKAVAYSFGKSVWIIEQGYYTFDGEFGTVGTSEPTTGTFGFYVAQTGDSVVAICLDGTVNSTVLNSITLNHIEVDGSPMNINQLVNGSYALLAIPKTGMRSVSGLSMYEDYAHDWENAFLQLHSPTNLTVDHSWFSRIMSNAGAHGNGVAVNPGVNETASNLTFSNDTWEDACGTSVLTFMNGTVNNIVVYGNTMFQTTATMIYPGGTSPVFCDSDGQIGDLGPGNAISTGVRIYNNTFYNGTAVARSGVFFFNPNSTNIVQSNNLFVNNQYSSLTTGCTGCSEDHNTVINQYNGGGFACGGAGDSCQGTSKTITSASVTSNVADVLLSSGHGLSIGSQVLVMGSQVNSTTPCGVDTYYPYPTVSNVVSSTEFQYTVQQAVPNATCQAGVGVLIASPVTQPFSSPSSKTFTLSGEAVDAHLDDGISLSSPYNIDPLGLTRGVDGTWERGAYELLGSQQVPAAPTGLSAIVQ